MMNRLSALVARRRWHVLAALTLLFVLLQVGIGLRYGVQLGGDGSRYLGGAERLLDGEPLLNKQPYYSGYVLYIAVMFALRLGTAGVVVGQIVLQYLAGLALWRMGARLKSELAGAVAFALFLLNPFIARWNFFTLTESLYASLLVLTVAAFVWAWQQGGPRWAAFAATTLAVVLLRPNGWFVPPVFAAIFVWSHPRLQPWRWHLTGAAAAVGVAGPLLMPQIWADYQGDGPSKEWAPGEVVWGYPPWRIDMPGANGHADVFADETSRLPYVARHPLACAKLAGLRIAAALAQVRPFYSWPHNAAKLLLLIPVYLFAGLAVWRQPHGLEFQVIVGVVAVHLLIIGATFAEWDGRYITLVYPLIGLLAGVGMSPNPVGESVQHQKRKDFDVPALAAA